MAAPLKATLPPDCQLSAGYIIRITALDPNSGAVVAGVQLTDVSFFVTDVLDVTEDTSAPFPLLVPSDEIA